MYIWSLRQDFGFKLIETLKLDGFKTDLQSKLEGNKDLQSKFGYLP